MAPRPTRQYKKWSTLLLLSLTLPLVACGDDTKQSSDAGSTSKTAKKAEAAGSDATKRSFEQIQDGQVQLVLSGAVQNEDANNASSEGEALSEGDHVYRPARGTGRADYIRKGSNADGPYSFVIYTEAIHEKHPDDVTRTFITVNLPADATPGTYTTAAYKDADDDQAQARITGHGYGWTFARDIDGVVDIIELDDTLSAAWDFTAKDASGREAQVQGAVKQLSFSPQPELLYELTVNDDKNEDRIRAGYGAKDDRLTLLGGTPPIYIDLPSGVKEGEYDIQESSDHKVRVDIPGLSYDELAGQVTIKENGSDYLDVAFELSGDGKDSVQGKGEFTYVPLELIP